MIHLSERGLRDLASLLGHLNEVYRETGLRVTGHGPSAVTIPGTRNPSSENDLVLNLTFNDEVREHVIEMEG